MRDLLEQTAHEREIEPYAREPRGEIGQQRAADAADLFDPEQTAAQQPEREVEHRHRDNADHGMEDADMDGQPWCSVDYSGAAALIVGSEGSGVSRLLKEKSDVTVSLPMENGFDSLNASVAAGIVLYEIMRQRKGIKAK